MLEPGLSPGGLQQRLVDVNNKVGGKTQFMSMQVTGKMFLKEPIGAMLSCCACFKVNPILPDSNVFKENSRGI